MPAADPFDLYRRLAVPSRPSFLLESGSGPLSTARYSFFGTDPYLVLSGRGKETALASCDGVTVVDRAPWACLVERLRPATMGRRLDLPPFVGGGVGCLSYDLVRQFESLPSQAQDDLALPDIEFLFVDQVAAFDHQTRTLHLLFAPPMERFVGESRDKLYREGCDRLGEWAAKVTAGHPAPASSLLPHLTITPDQTPEAYRSRVTACKDYIKAGDIYQANLSHRFTVGLDSAIRRPFSDSAVALYQRLRSVNPSPFSALMQGQHYALVSSSPERLVRLQGRIAETRPIAGTRPRGRSPGEDERLRAELLANAKERAEHIMLIDLERNDLGRVCRYGTVRVDEFMTIEAYSHVSHIVSNVTGALRDDLDGFDLIRAVFPGGTITGVPKIRCMEVIEELEPVRRGPYTGALGYISWTGDLDFNILIRTLLLTDTAGYLQVGAGIVADSDPEREYQETLFKAQAALQALDA